MPNLVATSGLLDLGTARVLADCLFRPGAPNLEAILSERLSKLSLLITPLRGGHARSI